MGSARGRIVEFVGLPAAGKSRVAREVQDRLTARMDGEDGAGQPVTTSSGKRDRIPATVAAGRIVSITLRTPRRSLAAARAVRDSDQRNRTKAIRFVLYHQYLRAELGLVRRSDELHLADQGILQHLRRVHLTANAAGTAYLESLAATCYPPLQPDLVVFVDVNHRTRMSRAKERGTDIDDELLDPDHPAIQDDHESYADVKELVPTLADDLGIDIPTMTIENRADNLDENVERIATAIRAMRGSERDGRSNRASASAGQSMR